MPLEPCAIIPLRRPPYPVGPLTPPAPFCVNIRIGGGGYQGPPGDRGFQGFQGKRGFQGRGFQGPRGYQGRGFQGPRGFQGRGFQGPRGYQGHQGRRGPQGFQGRGYQGPRGFQGPRGYQGFQGRRGHQGRPGRGAQGYQGPQGKRGFQGRLGRGYQGGRGPQGPRGFQGKGCQALRGPQGPRGYQGRPGAGCKGGISGTWPLVVDMEVVGKLLKIYWRNFSYSDGCLVDVGNQFSTQVDLCVTCEPAPVPGPCCNCETTKDNYSVTLSGVTTGDGTCSFCSNWNNSYVLTRVGTCTWSFTTAGPTCVETDLKRGTLTCISGTTWTLTFESRLEETPPVSILHIVYTTDDFKCLTGTTTFVGGEPLNPGCSGWPSTISMTPV